MKENKNFIRGNHDGIGKYIPEGVGIQGVYILYHDITGEFYIGKSEDINRRLSHHFGRLKRGISSNRPLQELYNNSTYEDFSYDYIELSVEEGYNHVEDFMIDKYSNDELCLNSTLTKGGWVKNPKMEKYVDSYREKLSEHARNRVGDKNPFYGKKHSEKTKKYVSELFMGREHNSEAEPIVINGEKYRTLKEAGEILGLSESTISHRVRSEKYVFINWYKYKDGSSVGVKDERMLYDPKIKTIHFMYEIEGEIFFRAKDISDKYGIARSTVNYRIKSDKYEKWNKLV